MASNIQTLTDVSKWKLFAKFQKYHPTRTDWTHLTGFIFVPKNTSMNASLSFQWMHPFHFNECVPFVSMNSFLSFQWMRPFHFNECVPFISMNAFLSFQWIRSFHFNEWSTGWNQVIHTITNNSLPEKRFAKILWLNWSWH